MYFCPLNLTTWQFLLFLLHSTDAIGYLAIGFPAKSVTPPVFNWYGFPHSKNYLIAHQKLDTSPVVLTVLQHTLVQYQDIGHSEGPQVVGTQSKVHLQKHEYEN